jgi:hypothetical protein
VVVTATQFVVAPLLALGLFTRPAGAILAIFFLNGDVVLRRAVLRRQWRWCLFAGPPAPRLGILIGFADLGRRQ